MEVENVQIGTVSDLSTSDRFGWVTVNADLKDGEFDVTHSIEVKVAVRYERDWTIQRVQETAFEKAKSALRIVSQQFDNRSLGEFQRERDEREAAQEAQVSEFRLELPSS